MRALDQKVDALQRNPNVQLRIEGNADDSGSDEYNLALSQRRAAIVGRLQIGGRLAPDPAARRLHLDSPGAEVADLDGNRARDAEDRRCLGSWLDRRQLVAEPHTELQKPVVDDLGSLVDGPARSLDEVRHLSR